MKKTLTAMQKREIIISRLSRKAGAAVSQESKKRKIVAKTVRKIFKQYGGAISELSKN